MLPRTAITNWPKSLSCSLKSDDQDSEREVSSLVARFKSGDQSAFAGLVSCYRDPVAALAYRMVNNYDEAADIAQDVFVKLARHIERYDQNRRFSTWLYRVTINASIDYMRRQRRHRHEPLADYSETLVSSQPDPALLFRRQQIGWHVREAARRLTERQRSAFQLRDIEGCGIDTVADIMDMPQATVRWYLHRARNNIRHELSRLCPHLLLSFGVK